MKSRWDIKPRGSGVDNDHRTRMIATCNANSQRFGNEGGSAASRAVIDLDHALFVGAAVDTRLIA